VTTVAWDGRYLACDGLMTSANDRVLSRRAEKMVMVQTEGAGTGAAELTWSKGVKVLVVTGAGNYDDWEEYVRMLRETRSWKWPPEGREKTDCEIVEVEVTVRDHVGPLDARRVDGHEWDTEVVFRVREERGRPDEGCEVPYALGSGGSYAMGAMDAGADAREAVAAACRYDVFSGGRILFFDTARPELGVQTWDYSTGEY
jgi:hypothetical protein